jgi:hypothetical protein
MDCELDVLADKIKELNSRRATWQELNREREEFIQILCQRLTLSYAELQQRLGLGNDVLSVSAILKCVEAPDGENMGLVKLQNKTNVKFLMC